MKRIIRLTESDLHRIVRESVRRIITEEGEGGAMGGGFAGGASSDVGLNANGTGDPSMGVAYPFGDNDDVIRRNGYNSHKKNKNGKKQENRKDFFGPALSRGGSISVNRTNQ